MPMRTSSNPALYTFDAAKRAEHGNICGVDEAGRGPLCGPVCVAAVILNPDDPIEGVNDSKKLSEKRREALFDEIIARALCYQIVFISPQEIDERNILWATMDGMEQAVAGLAVTPDYVLVDGNRCPPNLAQPAEAVVKGDANSASIAAASILAKVSRDRYMLELDKQYPQYQFVVAGVSWLDKQVYTPYLDGSDVRYVCDKTYELLSVSDAAVVTSGTATLETALLGIPQIVCYRRDWASMLIGKAFLKIPYVSLVNLVLRREAVRELLGEGAVRTFADGRIALFSGPDGPDKAK